jgi:glycosyl-4,4'-diaponeurosporenoate acyltransferase
MPIELSFTWTLILNVLGWPVIQLGLAWAFTRMPADWFQPPRPAAWERGGRCYEAKVGIKLWKDKLPDGAAWFGGGFAKGRLGARDPAYLIRFARETWRGELCHWCAIACTPLFFLWNPWWGNAVMITYALASNLPCILVQRYNRARLASRRGTFMAT